VYTKGAMVEFSARKTSMLNSSKTKIIGSSQYFFLTLKKSHSSAKNDIYFVP